MGITDYFRIQVISRSSYAKIQNFQGDCQSSIFTGQVPYLMPNQQQQRTEAKNKQLVTALNIFHYNATAELY